MAPRGDDTLDPVDDQGYSEQTSSEQPSFTCPRCGRTSYHPMDIKQGYCGNCHDWTRDG